MKFLSRKRGSDATKVYCGKCRHKKDYVGEYSIAPYCNSNAEIVDTPLGLDTVRDECNLKNADNKCEEYEPNLLTRILG